MNITRYFSLAKNASEFSECKIKVGSIITYKNKIISIGWNTSKSNPIQKKYNVYRTTNERQFDVDKHHNGAHAECMAIRNAIRTFNGDLSKCSIFVYSEKKDGNTRLTRPCRACSKLLKDYNITNVYYVDNENNFIYEKMS